MAEGGSSPININAASHEDLVQLPGIQAARAREILRRRMERGGFLSEEDFKNIPKLGPKVWQPLLENKIITFGPPIEQQGPAPATTPPTPPSPTNSLRPGTPVDVDLDKSVTHYTAAEVRQLRDHLVVVEKKLERCFTLCQSYKGNITHANKRVAELEEQCKLIQQERDSTVRDLANRLAICQQRCDEVTRERHSVVGELTQRITLLQQGGDGAQQVLQQQLLASQQQGQALQQELGAAQQQQSSLQQELATAQQHSNAVQQDLTVAQQNADTLRQQLAALRQSSEKETQALRQELASVQHGSKEQKEAIQQELDQLQHKIKEQREAAKRELDSKVRDLNQQTTDLQAKCKLQRKSIEEEQSASKELNSQLVVLRKKYNDQKLEYEEERKEHSRALRESTVQVTTLERMLLEKNKQCVELQQQIESLQSEIAPIQTSSQPSSPQHGRPRDTDLTSLKSCIQGVELGRQIEVGESSNKKERPSDDWECVQNPFTGINTMLQTKAPGGVYSKGGHGAQGGARGDGQPFQQEQIPGGAVPSYSQSGPDRNNSQRPYPFRFPASQDDLRTRVGPGSRPPPHGHSSRHPGPGTTAPTSQTTSGFPHRQSYHEWRYNHLDSRWEGRHEQHGLLDTCGDPTSYYEESNPYLRSEAPDSKGANLGSWPRGNPENPMVFNRRDEQANWDLAGRTGYQYPRQDERDGPHRQGRSTQENYRGRDPKLTTYNGKVPWRAYEVKLQHMAQKYQWDNQTKLTKLVEALEDKALTFFSGLPEEVQTNYTLVTKKFNARFGPKEPPKTVRRQLKRVEQESEEVLEEYAERCQRLAYDAWGDISPEVAEAAAIEAFFQGALDSEAALTAMHKEPDNMDHALELVKEAIHNRKSVSGRPKGAQKAARTVSFLGDVTTDVTDSSIRVAGMPFSSKATNQSDPTMHRLESDVQELRTSFEETQGQVSQILKLLTDRSRSRSPSRTIICYKCNTPGHIAKECPDRSRSPSPARSRGSSPSPAQEKA